MSEKAHLSSEPIAVPAEFLDDFWRQIYPEGIPLSKVLDELHDLQLVASQVPLVYDHVTGGKVSKPNTDASVVIALHDDHVTELVRQAIKDEREEWEAEHG